MPKPPCGRCAAHPTECVEHQCSACLGVGLVMGGYAGDTGAAIGTCCRCWGVQREPYYAEDGITIFHGDCREVLPLLQTQVDLVLTDPPWPMDKAAIMQGNKDAIELWDEASRLLVAKRLLVWHAIHNDPRDFLNPLKGWPYLRAVYIRRAIPGYYGRVLMDGEMIHALGEWPSHRKGRMVIPGGLSITYVASDRLNGHPGPRSLIATRWLVNWWSDPDSLILDPFLGSGTTLRAAKDLGRYAIGIEIEEKYCAIAAERMAQAVLPLEPRLVSQAAGQGQERML